MSAQNSHIPQPDRQPSGFTSRNLWEIVILFVAVACIYGQTLGFGFIWDDDYFVAGNPSLTSWRCIPSWFTDASVYQSSNTFWRPGRNFSFLADWYLAGGRQFPPQMHAHNVLMHLACALMLLWMLRRAVRVFVGEAEGSSAPWLAGTFAAALVWAVHPLCTETVAWIKCRDEQMFTLLYLWGTGLFLGGLREGARPGAGRAAAVLALGIAAALCKEMALSFPILLFLIFLLSPGRKNPAWSWGTCAGSAATLAAFVVMRAHVLKTTGQITDRLGGSFAADMMTMVRAVARYVELSVLPVRQLADYSGFPVTHSPLEWAFLGAALLLIGITVAVCVFGKRQKLIVFAWFGFLISLLPVSNIVPTMQYLAERFMYLPLALLSAALIPLGAKIRIFLRETDPDRRRLFTTLLVILLISLGASACLRASVWGSPLTLFRTTWRDGYTSLRVLVSRLAVCTRYGLTDEIPAAAAELDRMDLTRASAADNALRCQTLGRCLLYLDKTDAGLSYTLEALRFDPKNFDARTDLAFAYGVKGETTRTLQLLDELLAERPDDANLRQNRQRALQQLQKQK